MRVNLLDKVHADLDRRAEVLDISKEQAFLRALQLGIPTYMVLNRGGSVLFVDVVGDLGRWRPIRSRKQVPPWLQRLLPKSKAERAPLSFSIFEAPVSDEDFQSLEYIAGAEGTNITDTVNRMVALTIALEEKWDEYFSGGHAWLYTKDGTAVGPIAKPD